jgi:hypothetical protein
LPGVKVIENGAFSSCGGLSEVEFGVKLETIEQWAFQYCISLTRITMPSVKTIGRLAFNSCKQLTDLDLPEGLETIQERAFHGCNALRRIIMPLRDNMIEYCAFSNCSKRQQWI